MGGECETEVTVVMGVTTVENKKREGGRRIREWEDGGERKNGREGERFFNI